MHVFKVHASGIFDNIATVAVAEVTKFPVGQYFEQNCKFRFPLDALRFLDLKISRLEKAKISSHKFVYGNEAMINPLSQGMV